MKNLITMLVFVLTLSVNASAQTGFDYKLSSKDSLSLSLFNSKISGLTSILAERKLIFTTIYKSYPKNFSKKEIKKEIKEAQSIYNEIRNTLAAFQIFARSCNKEHEFGPNYHKDGLIIDYMNNDILSVTECNLWIERRNAQDYINYLKSCL